MTFSFHYPQMPEHVCCERNSHNKAGHADRGDGHLRQEPYLAQDTPILSGTKTKVILTCDSDIVRKGCVGYA